MSTVTHLRGFDADNHYYEAMDAFTRYIEPEYAKRTMQWAEIDGRTRLLVGGRVNRFIPNPTFDRLAAPGSLEQYFRGHNEGGESVVELFGHLEPVDPAYRDRDVRLKVMDDQQLDGALFFPTLGVGMEQALVHDLPAARAAFRAFNRWLDEDWGFHYQERIFAAPYLTLSDVDECVAELEWVLDRGARLVIFQYGPVMTPTGYKSPGDECFDPIWARIEEAGIVAGFHGGDSAYSQLGAMWGESGEAEAFRFRLMRSAISASPIADTMAALVLHGVPARFPRIRFVTVETGADWVGPLLDRLGKVYKQQPKAFTEDPRDVFRRNVWVSPFYENDLAELGELIGVDRMLMGSDWPHTEGLAEPLAFVDDLLDAGFGQDDIRKICHDNGAALVAPPR
jgi:predicted TIM-barrel fold metal-dependent hydrolase